MDAALHASFEAHLAGCPHCTHYLEQMRATIRVAGTIEADELSPEFRAGLLRRVRGLEAGMKVVLVLVFAAAFLAPRRWRRRSRP